MLLVKTTLGTSKISGIGLFANQFIPKDTIIWKYTDGVDLKISDEKLLELEKEYPLDDLKKYLYRSNLALTFRLIMNMIWALKTQLVLTQLPKTLLF